MISYGFVVGKLILLTVQIAIKEKINPNLYIINDASLYIHILVCI